MYLAYYVSCIVYRVSCIVYRVSCIVYRVSCIVYRVSCIVYRVSCISDFKIGYNDAQQKKSVLYNECHRAVRSFLWKTIDYMSMRDMLITQT